MKSTKVHLMFPGDSASRPLTSHLIKEYDVTFNILQARIEPGHPGELVIELKGEEDNLQAGLRFLEDEGIIVQQLSRSIIWDADSCVSCGSCTSVCQSGALQLDSNDQLSFDQDKCIVCQMCIQCCPMKVLRLSYH